MVSQISKKEFLKLYRDILKSHRILQEPMKSMGDSYVKNEWRLHKKVKDNKVLNKFYTEWDQYLNFMDKQRESILDQAMEKYQQEQRAKSNDYTNEEKELFINTLVGKDLDEFQINQLNKDQKEKLNQLKNETKNLFNEFNQDQPENNNGNNNNNNNK
ncbi:hypothetical protein DICPUDRAFT_80055 [Dictyostelium purpureum]|uniref:Succinate dehydrogenase assembly factor 3 n=1 Tax=Dictyostelium purpureum TaxID=5786 RepID=F0ZPE0_DICPU|nr:uncharacterized protein DICPUDRAFT_80055 [Dictyostelium purpureum]EGC34174.1 hypothetical protein DICPUDRAFT_80055 [Dictyostelium purpureum]|eukprot:XP_003289278.1 hypothetical protein DICPUDRAFT_80055 [Dictyostelium purpureum]